MAFDETNDGTLQLKAEDNATSVTLNVIMMSIQDHVIHYMTTNATNGNALWSFHYKFIVTIV